MRTSLVLSFGFAIVGVVFGKGTLRCIVSDARMRC